MHITVLMLLLNIGFIWFGSVFYVKIYYLLTLSVIYWACRAFLYALSLSVEQTTSLSISLLCCCHGEGRGHTHAPQSSIEWIFFNGNKLALLRHCACFIQ